MGRNAKRIGERTPAAWYQEAVRWYLDGHQGCACCQNRHCVFRSEWGARVEFYCTTCDFSASHDQETGGYFAAVGEPASVPGVLLGEDSVLEAPPPLGRAAGGK